MLKKRILTYIFRNLNERNEWLEALNSAVEDHRNRKASFNNSQEVVIAEDTSSSPPLGDTCPVWIPDSHVTMCQDCCVLFTLTCRRHHCRACGRVLCATCTDNRAPLRYSQFQPARVCDACYEVLHAALSPDPDLSTKFKPRGSAGSNNVKTPKKVSRDESQMCGYLSLRARGGRWKKSWYCLHGGSLLCYDGKEDSSPGASYELSEFPDISSNGLVTFLLRMRDPPPEAGLVTELHFTTDTAAARDAWVKAILAANTGARLMDFVM